MIFLTLIGTAIKPVTGTKFSTNQTMDEKITLTVIYDNYNYKPNLKTAWGFSCLIRGLDKTILFDTGGNGQILLSNMEKLNIDIQDIDLVVLSHEHGDHTGGLSDLLERNNQIYVYLPKSFPDRFKINVEETGAEIVEVKKSMQIFGQVYSTGQLGTHIKEQSLIIKTEEGAIVITGCAHPGIVNIIRKAKEITGEKVYLVIGGFHLSGASGAQINEIIKEFEKEKVQKVGPCHCSGDRTRKLFKEAYGSDYIQVGVGKLIKVEQTD